MNKIQTLLLLIFITTFISSFSSAATSCFPKYQCGSWSQCDDSGFQTRICEDTACGKRDIVERSFCGKPDCQPKIECGEWSICTYTEKTNDLIEGKISFGGYRTRLCEDSNGCVDGFIQEGACSEVSQLMLSPKTECGVEFLEVSDSSSGRNIAKINLQSWEQDKFDISFVQGSPTHCPTCYNAIQDQDETGIDCGGSCSPCKKDNTILLTASIVLLWSLSITFAIFSIREFTIMKKGRSLFTDETR